MNRVFGLESYNLRKLQRIHHSDHYRIHSLLEYKEDTPDKQKPARGGFLFGVLIVGNQPRRTLSYSACRGWGE